MRFLLLSLILLSCSSEKKLRRKYVPSTDNEERITYDWSGDGNPETVILSPALGPGQYRDIVIYRGVMEGESKEIIFTNRNLIPRRARPGATLKLRRDRSFHITVDSSGSGRTSEVVTWKISWKRGRYLLTGYSRDWIDKLDPHDHRTCDVDLRSGRGKRNGKPVKFKPFTVDLIDLNDKFLPSICDF